MHKPIILLSSAFALLLVTGIAIAQGGYRITSSTFGGGGSSTGEGYSLNSATGQSGTSVLEGGEYQLTSGHIGTRLSDSSIYLPYVQR